MVRYAAFYLSIHYQSARINLPRLTLKFAYATLNLPGPLWAFLISGLWEQTLTKTRSQLMMERLRELQATSPDIEATAIVSLDGLAIASALPQEVEEDKVAAMSAAMLSLGERIATTFGRGSLEQVFIKGEFGYVLLMSVGEDAVLTALAREHAKLGLILLDMRRAVEDIIRLI
jgi:predicted regulator of Ras-like GTPase activity (Roadblock/LC7/MglB family)